MTGKRSLVECCIVDEGINVVEFCYVGFGNSLVPDGRDITVLGRDVSVPAGPTIGPAGSFVWKCRLFRFCPVRGWCTL